MIQDLILGIILGVALGASAFVSVLLFLTFIVGSYVYEKTVPRETKPYLIVFASICVVLILVSLLALLEVYDEPGTFQERIQSIWHSRYLWRALPLSALLVFCGSMLLFLAGPLEVARRIRLPRILKPKRHVQKPDHQRVETSIPARLDRLPWGAFHTLVAVALGITWILNGLEVTLAGNLTPALEKSLKLPNAVQIGIAHSAYLAGLVLGSLFFGWLTDRLGRKKLFFVTLVVYLLSTALTGLSWNVDSLIVFRFLTGTGIGGEYAAINSTIQELIPAKYRGRTDLLISGTFWIGAAIGAVGSTVLLNSTLIDPEVGWRVAFLIGAVLAIIVLLVRSVIPESPRWLMTHNRIDEAEAIVASIEERFRGQFDSKEPLSRIQLVGRSSTPLVQVIKTIFLTYPKRALVSSFLMASQALLYNAIFFSNATMLGKFFNIQPWDVGWYFLPFAFGNFLGPVLLGPLFDRLGRKRMISGTYIISAVLIAICAYLFKINAVSALSLSLAWMVTFFFASAAASAAYLTAGEIFPLEIRAIAIAFFFAIGTGFAVVCPFVFTALATTGEPATLYKGYLVLSMLMSLAALIELLWGVDAECRPLEAVAAPLTYVK
jgi:MFS family permease